DRGEPTEEGLPGHAEVLEALRGLDPVEEGNDRGPMPGEIGRDRPDGVEVVAAEGGRVIPRGDAGDPAASVGLGDPEVAGPEGLEVLAPREELHVVAGPREHRAVVAPHSTCPEDRDPHGPAP